MTYKQIDRVVAVGYCMAEGRNYDEVGEEFGLKGSVVKRLINEQLQYAKPKLYALVKNKPYKALQRVIHQNITVDEACKFFRVPREKFDDYLKSIFKEDKAKYIAYKTKIYNVEQNKKCKDQVARK